VGNHYGTAYSSEMMNEFVGCLVTCDDLPRCQPLHFTIEGLKLCVCVCVCVCVCMYVCVCVCVCVHPYYTNI